MSAQSTPAGGPALEIATFEVIPGQEDAFLAGYRQAREAIAAAPGCRTVRLTRGIESPSRFVLLVEWDSVQAHQEFRADPERFAAWRGPISPFFAGPPAMEHFADVPA